jgi:DNA-binding PadR family transcriptional regulator
MNDRPTHYGLTAFQRDLLEAVAAVEDDPYGLALKAYLEDRYPEPINHSRLYQNLSKLVEQALLDKGSLDERTNTYTLTERGRRLLNHHARTLARVSDPVTVTDGGRR